MADIEDFKEALRRIEAEFLAAMPAIMQDYAYEARVLAERNILERGFGENYSTTEVPAFFFYGKQINAQGKQIVEKKKKEKEGLSWSAFKAAQGLPVDHVTLSYSNEMWRGLSVLEVRRDGDRFIAYLGGNNKDAQQKLNWNYARYGDFVKKGLSADDFEYLNNQAGDKIMKIIKRNL